MGMALRLLAVIIVAAGVWIWVSGRAVTTQVPVRVPSTQLSASVGIPLGERGAFDEEGTILIDRNEGTSGTAYILYTDYADNGEPQVKTKRLVFAYRDTCADANLLCASNQPGIPVGTEEKVRVIGYVKNERVEVEELYRI